MDVLISLLLAGLLLLAINLSKVYRMMSVREIKRRARAGDQTAALLHKAVVYGASLKVLLWLIIGIAAAAFFTYTARHLNLGLSLLLSSLAVWMGFAWLSSLAPGRPGIWTSKHLAGPLGWLLKHLHRPLNRLYLIIQRLRPITIHTGLYDKEDLLNLLSRQHIQTDNRIEDYELELAWNAMTFGDKLVGGRMTPRRMVKSVSVDDSIGPMLMSELHDSGFSRFPVYGGKKDNFVGTLFLKDLIRTKASGLVKDAMRREVCYVHEDQSLYDALQAILKTRQHLLIVVNSFEEYVGVLSIEDVLEQIIGQPIVDEFDQYDDLRAVAQRAADQEHAKRLEAPTTVETDEQVIN